MAEKKDNLSYKEMYFMYKQQCEEQTKYILELSLKLEIYNNHTCVHYDEERNKYYIAVDCDFGCDGEEITKEEFEVLK